MKKSKVGIIGYGMVGGAVGAWFKHAAKYDIKKFPDGLTAVNQAEIVFICVPTPYHSRRGYDYRAVEKAVRSISGRKIIVLKSTVLPGKTAEFQKRFPQHTWLFNPEFLRDKTAVQDFLKPDRQVVGMAKNTSRHVSAARRVMHLLPKSPVELLTTAAEAECIKLGANSFMALKTVYANMIYDICQQLGIDYEMVRRGITADPRIVDSGMKIWLDGYRGYSGKCFPKDVGALIAFGKKTKHRLPLLEVADAINWKLLPTKYRKR